MTGRVARPSRTAWCKILPVLVICTAAVRAETVSGETPLSESPAAANVRSWNSEVLRVQTELQANDSEALRTEGARAIALRAAALSTLIEQDPRAALAL